MGIISMNSFTKKTVKSQKPSIKNNQKTFGALHKEDVQNILVYPEVSIKEALKAMDASSLETILVVDHEQRLIGLATDGDIRRAILDDTGLEENIGKIMNTDFTAVSHKTPAREIIKLMKKNYFKQLPMIDEQGKVVDIVLLKDILLEKSEDNYVVLMAGGMGTRLRPLTNELPKPMLKVGDRPMLEIIIDQFKKYGFRNFMISINYLADIVEGYFGDGSNLDVNIQYIRETKRLGTAGCLKLVENSLDKPFFVMNGDLLTKLDFEDMMRFHTSNGFDMSMGIREHEYQIPYGVVHIEGNKVQEIEEKPVNRCMMNAGVYCLNPDVIRYIPENEYYDMTSLMNACRGNNGSVGGYHIKGYWMDIGHIDDYHQANSDYELVFKDYRPSRSYSKRAAAGRR